MISKKKLYLSLAVFLFSVGSVGFLYRSTLIVHDTIQFSKLSDICVNAIIYLRQYRQWSHLKPGEKHAIIVEILGDKYEKQFEDFSPGAYLQHTQIADFSLNKYDSLFWDGDPAGRNVFDRMAFQILWFVPPLVLLAFKRWFQWLKQ